MENERDLVVEERILVEKELNLTNEKNALREIKESCEEEFYHIRQLLNSICEENYRNASFRLFEDLEEEWRIEERKSVEHLEEYQLDIQAEEKSIQEKIQELANEKQRCDFEEEGIE